MSRSETLREHALRIWQVGLAAVRANVLVKRAVRCEDDRLVVGGLAIPLSSVRRIAVVGAGKAGAAMAAALEEVLGPDLLAEKHVTGWVNVPDDCVPPRSAQRPLRAIHLHGARPPGVNEPTDAGVEGTARILELIESLTSDDLVFCLISGGGSALLPSPVGVSLEEKQAVTRFLSAAGASIGELNAVRKRLSRVKGGGLARACKAGRLVSLIVSDVIGDPLDVIASGPTAEDHTTFQDALAVLQKYGASLPEVSQRLLDFIAAGAQQQQEPEPLPSGVANYVIGNNSMALAAAAQEAHNLGYDVLNLSSCMEGHAEDVGQILAGIALGICERGEPLKPPACVLSGGEPVVSLVPVEKRGMGGRNQQLVLAAVEKLGREGLKNIAILSGGTDGEDGPTDAAGAVADEHLAAEAERRGLDPGPYLATNNAYAFFEPLGGLIKTGPTQTNVMDVRVVLVG